MRKQIRHISVHQTSKVIATVHTLLVTIFLFLPLVINAILIEGIHRDLIGLVALPFIYWILMYIIIAIGIWFYNLIAQAMGGIEFDLVDMEAKQVASEPLNVDPRRP